MKKSKLLLLIGIALLFTNSSVAQDQEIVSVNSLLGVFSKLSDNIDNLIDKQEAKRLYRHLDYFKSDMNKYLAIRKELTTYLETKNYSSFDTLRVQDAVLNLQAQIVKLGKRLETISAYADDTLLDDADDMLNDIDNGTQRQRKQYINKLEDLSNGETIDKAQLKKDGAQIYKTLQNTIVLINKIKGKLKQSSTCNIDYHKLFE